MTQLFVCFFFLFFSACSSGVYSALLKLSFNGASMVLQWELGLTGSQWSSGRVGMEGPTSPKQRNVNA